ncbi:MAG: HAD family phosphatase [Candidatus Tenebribacter davisii]|jgi:HAD superfamily hydrolase (TIGR01549 family)|nr:HAD family phosphatase [Candidatus Tenebribacter davisii]
MQKIKAVIFDMDGVIIDSEPIYMKIQEELFNDLGFSVSKKEYDEFIGAGMHYMWHYLSVKHKLPFSIEQLITMNNKLTYDKINNSNALETTTGFIPFINNIKSKRLKTAVASSTSKKIVNLILSKLGIIDLFDIVISTEEVAKGKPEPDVFLKAAKLLSEDTDNCVAIEDSTNGIKAVTRAGIKCIGFLNINSGKQDLSSSDIIVNSFSEIDLAKLNH